VLCTLLLTACASAGEPPGGPPDPNPPQVILVTPDSGAVLETPPRHVEITFDEVVNERVVGSRTDIYYAVILSPDTTVPRVSWRRNRLTVETRGGFKPGRVYRVELLPVITDLRQNRLRSGRIIVFSTGPEIPTAALSGTVVDWPAGRAVVNGLIEAVLLPDSLPYRALTDSAGDFTLRQIPPGEYVVYGTVDQSNDRRRGPRETFDSVRVTLGDTASVEVFAFPHDTTGPRLRQVEMVDSLTIRLSFDRPLDPTLVIDTAQVHLAPQSDTTARFGVAAILMPRQLDSVRAAETAARAAARAPARDTGRAPGDTALPARRPLPDTVRARPPRPDSAAATPRRDSTRAQRMIARRPPPTDVRIVRLFAPLAQGERYAVFVSSVRSLSGVTATPPPGQLLVPRPRATDTTRTRATDTTRLRAPAETTTVRPQR
jgi:hypothetical protein